ncbi:divalent-cation tolerance protein CutA [bacterium]|nr:divalent-cation tolerance protein CutA [bacterium]
MSNTSTRIVMSSFPSLAVAKKVARIVVQEKLCACIQIQSPMTSVYTWKGTLEESREFMVYFKTLSHLEKKLYQRIKDHHPYDCPEIISIAASNVDENYQQWMKNTCLK